MVDRAKRLSKENLLDLLHREDDLLEEAQARHKRETEKIRIALSIVDDDEKAEAINAVLLMLADGPEHLSASSPADAQRLFTEAAQAENGESRPRKRRGIHYQRILSVLPAIEGGNITQPVIRAKLQEMYPEYGATVQVPTISSTLRQLRKDGVLELVKEGAGAHPHEYRRVP